MADISVGDNVNVTPIPPQSSGLGGGFAAVVESTPTTGKAYWTFVTPTQVIVTGLNIIVSKTI